MARPIKKTIDYFSHDTSAQDSRTLSILQFKFKNDGYAAWFKLLEILGRSDGLVFDCRNDDNWQFLQAKTLLSDSFLTEIIDTLALIGAIDKELWERKIIWSQNFVDRLEPVFRNRHQPMPRKPVINSDNSVEIISMPNNPTVGVVSMPNNPTSADIYLKKVHKVKKSKEDNKERIEKKEASWEEYVNELRQEYIDLNFDNELEKFHLYWSEGKRKLQRPKLALKNWLDKAREFKIKENANVRKGLPGNRPAGAFSDIDGYE